MPTDTLLGKPAIFPERYAPEVLHVVPRAESRKMLGIFEPLPFRGKDIWNAYELTWLERTGKPAVAVATIEVDAESPLIIESKSLKLYLNALAMERFDSPDDVTVLIRQDLSEVVQDDVRVLLTEPRSVAAAGIRGLPGLCIDDADVVCEVYDVDPTLLEGNREAGPGDSVSEELHSHLLRSLCPVTGQPDFGSVLIRYRGVPIDRLALLRYLVSYRSHNGFHESCVERIFVDLKERCAPEALTVYGRFNRRGGLDINPFRSDYENSVEQLRLWRQ